MVNGNLTFQDFTKLSSEQERYEKYKKLSDEDKFFARCSMDTGVETALCDSCIYAHQDFTCDAFPKGIPTEQLDKVLENPKIECASGIRYKPKN